MRCVMWARSLRRWREGRRLASVWMMILSGMVVSARDKAGGLTNADFSFFSDYNFFRDSAGHCVLYGDDPEQPPFCPKGKAYKGSSGYRKIPASKCKGGVDKTQKVDRECGESHAVGKVNVIKTRFERPLEDYFYFNNTEVVIIKATDVWMSTDGGVKWEKQLDGKKVTAVVADPYHGDRAWFITSEKELWVSDDAGKSFKMINIPQRVASDVPRTLAIRTHAKQKGWLLWMGEPDDCGLLHPDQCHVEAWWSKDYGKNWRPLLTYVEQCGWADDGKFAVKDSETVFCVDREVKSGEQKTSRGRTRLARTRKVEKGASGFEVVLDMVVGYAVFEEYMVAAMVSVPAAAEYGYKLFG